MELALSIRVMVHLQCYQTLLLKGTLGSLSPSLYIGNYTSERDIHGLN